MRFSVRALLATCLGLMTLTACTPPPEGAKSVDLAPIPKVTPHNVFSDTVTGPEPHKPSEHGAASTPTIAANIDKPKITWAKPGFAPLFIHHGADQGQGIGDQIFSQVQELLPEYKHVNLKLNYSRLLEEFHKGTEVCAILHHKPEREAFLTYSKPIIIYPTYQLYLSDKGLERFKEKTDWSGEPMSFDHIMANSQGLTISITPKQSYGIERDEVLARHADKPEIAKNFADKEAMIKRLAASRMDMTLSLPLGMNYQRELFGIESGLTKIELTDVNKYDKSHIACSDTALGRRVIESLDAFEPALHERFKGLVPRWLTEGERLEYLRVYREYFFEDGSLP